MCNMEQCSRCRNNFDTCGYYDHTNLAPGSQYIRPLDNSKMFARWYKFSGRIGRLEYAITLVAAIVLYFFVLLGVGQILRLSGHTIDSEKGMYIYSIGCMIPSVYIAIAAGVKRTHDTRVSSWYSLVPLIPLFFINIITIVLFCAGCVYLFKDEGEDGVNEHGSNPVQPYSEQISLEGLV